jgi:DNA-binding NarL/FixJ family response regulator
MTEHQREVAGRKARILIVDDHPIVRECLAAHIARQPDLEFCGEAEAVHDALEKVKLLSPDLVVVDIILKSGQGLELIKAIKARGSAAKMLISSAHDESIYAERALHAGAMGYVSKQETLDKMVEAIRQVLAGKIYLSKALTERLLQRAVCGAPKLAPCSIDSLSDRELEVFTMIGRGVSTREIAKQLHLSVKTVETHRENIKHKLNLHNSSELCREAVQWVLEKGA